ncbi:MAG: hypothetical protein NWR72_04900, partial [Bacteroidia bacterium]|nr:hypothetical protein [Bacteroidia bacterium]
MILQEFFRRFHDLRYAIRDRYEIEEAASVSQLWLAHITGISWNIWLLRPDRAWDPAWDAAYQHGLEQLSAGIPVQHLMG